MKATTPATYLSLLLSAATAASCQGFAPPGSWDATGIPRTTTRTGATNLYVFYNARSDATKSTIIKRRHYSSPKISAFGAFWKANKGDDQPYNLFLPNPPRDSSSTTTDESAQHFKLNPQLALGGLASLLVVGALAVASQLGYTADDAVQFGQALVSHPQDTLHGITNSIQGMGTEGLLYFGLLYTVAEILAVPATPLTLSAGYLFGLTQGTGVVLVSATIAATVAFFVGKTLLRDMVEGILADNPKFAKLDKAIGQEGFKLLFLVRLSPIFPFALSNYVYGASSIDFASFFWGTLLGFAPGTLAYVYTGMAGKVLTSGSGDQPWYYYAAGLAVLVTVLKLVTDVATNLIAATEEGNEAAK